MAYEMLVGERALFVVWGRPDLADVDGVMAEFERLAAASGGQFTYITRVPATAEAPSAQMQRHINAKLKPMLDKFLTYHVVLEGQGFTAAAKRSVLALMFMAAGRRGLFFVHSRADEVLARVKPEARLDIATLLSAASTLGMLDAPPPTTSRTYRAQPTVAA